LITINQLSFKRNYNKILSDVGITLFPGACLNVVGNNGSGKSSLLKILAGIYPIKPNTIYYHGKDILQDLLEYKKQINYIGHKHGLKLELSVLDNLKFWASLKGWELALDAAIHTLGLTSLVDSAVYQLSAGWQKKVSLARLLLSPASIWLLDEPFSNLDNEGADILKNMIIARLNHNGIVIITSHQKLEVTPYTISYSLEKSLKGK